MAVVQISKIQIRRGRKNQGTGLPQLASGELAWAVDTQELYVGNGAVSEGAPYVGNTKVLTEHDSILDLVVKYTYKKGQETIEGSERTLQSRLDDGVVNARNYGIKSQAELVIGEDPDQTAKIQNAVDTVFAEFGPNVTIEFEPGVYEFSSTITLPSNVKLAGYGKDETVFLYTGTSDTSLFSTEADAVKIKLKDFTLKTADNDRTFLEINNAKDCEFTNIKFLFDDGNDGLAGSLADNRIGISLTGSGAISYNRFKGLEFRNLTYAVFSNSNASFNKFDECLLEYLYQGFNLGTGGTTGADYNTVSNSIFDKIIKEGIYVHKGTGNRSRGNTYKDVGSTNSGTFSTFNVIKFVTAGNSSVQDSFERSRYLEPDNEAYNNNPYMLEVDGVAYRENQEPRQISLYHSATPSLAFKLPLGEATNIAIKYVFKSTVFDQMRSGTITLAINKDSGLIQLSDDYDYVGTSENGEDALLFNAALLTSSGVSVLGIYYINNNVGDENTFTYTYSILS